MSMKNSLLLLAFIAIASAQDQYANTATLANPNPTGSFAPQHSPAFPKINTKIASSLRVTAVPTGAVPTGALPRAAPNLAGYPVAWATPPTDSAEVQAVINTIDWSLVPKAAVHGGNSQTGPSMSGYPSSDPYCDWSYNLCNVPKVKYLPPDIYYCPSPDTWGLTYDDGPLNPQSSGDPYAEPNLYNFLAAHNQKATLFYIGSNVLGYPQAAQRAFQDGHILCVHTWSHPPMTTLTNDKVVAELYWTLKVIKETTGVTPRCWRPPYGDVDDRVRSIAWQMGMRTILWDWDSNDWNIKGPDGGSLSSSTVDGYFSKWIADAKKTNHGHIVLEHELSDTTVNVAEKWLPQIQKAFKVVPATECFNISQPYWESQYRYPVMGSGTTTTRSATKTATSTTTTSSAPQPTGSPYITTYKCAHYSTATSSLNTCAKMESRYGVSASQIAAWNPTIDCSHNLSAGTRVCFSATAVVYKCAHYSTATANLNTCAKMMSRYSVSAANFALWNPTVDCSKPLPVGDRICFSAALV